VAAEPERDVTTFGAGAGVYHDLASPLTGHLGWEVEGYVGAAGGRVDGGGRLVLRSPRFLLGGGVDYNLRLEELRGVVSLQVAPARGGLFGRGGELRLDWLPGEGNQVQLGARLPLGQPLAGRTRPKRTSVELPPVPPRPRRVLPLPAPAVEAELDEMRGAARRIVRLSTVLEGLAKGTSMREVVRQAEAGVDSLRQAMAGDTAPAGGGVHLREARAYHAALERAFGLASGAEDSVALAAGTPVAAAARRIVLEEVFLPWNRGIGQVKSPDTLVGLIAFARARFGGWLVPRGDGPHDAALLATFDAWMAAVEEFRRVLSNRPEGGRYSWLPMALVLRPEEHRTQSQVDALLAMAAQEPFPGGNALLYVSAQQYQVELSRSILQAERYHLLWVSEYRGTDDTGQPDRIGFYQTVLGYLAALTRRVREYDRTGRLPTYLLVVDQAGVDANDGRLWLELLERPLEHRVDLPPRHAAMAEVLAALQDSLRQAVTDSRRLAREAASLGRDHVRQMVRVHVSVTQPADPTFRTPGFLGLPLDTDDRFRDHRKLVLRDVTESDPAVGEAIIAGVPVGDLYSRPEWDDRALVVTGPAAAEAKRAARVLLVRNGLREEDLPPPLRPDSVPADHPDRVALLGAMGASARVLQAHNRIGWGDKRATFVQFLLWDLVPPGTAILAPDPHWTEETWASRLVAAALRGCDVFLVAPSRANAPRDAVPELARTRETFARLFVVQRDLGELIRRGGGGLHVGLYTRRSRIGDAGARLWEADTTYGKHAFLRELFPFPEETWRMLGDHRARLDSVGPDSGALTQEDGEPRPALHRSTQFIASRALLEELAVQPETRRALDLSLRDPDEGATLAPEAGPIQAQGRLEAARELMRGWAGVPLAVRDSALLYLAVGTPYKDLRGLARNGEVIAVVSGPWSLLAYLDFWSLLGSTTWIERVEDVEELIP
jgi:hypothetical protein